MLQTWRHFVLACSMLLCSLWSDCYGQPTTDHYFNNSDVTLQRSDVSQLETKFNELQLRVEKLEDAYSGKHILVQQRDNSSSFFNKSWTEFKVGFGSIDGDYWIGNDRLHELTKDNKYKLRIDLLARNGVWYYAEYGQFIVDAESDQYMLHSELYNGTAGDCLNQGGRPLWMHNRMRFTTFDRDNDMKTGRSESPNCALWASGGFWYNSCGCALLNSPSASNNGWGFTWALLKNVTGSERHNLLMSRMTLLRKQA